MRNIFVFFIVCVGLITPQAASAFDFKVNGLCYEVLSDENKTVELVYSSNDRDNYKALLTITIPEHITFRGVEYTVTSIGSHAMNWCSSLTKVKIPSTVTRIGDWVFWGSSKLKTIEVDENNPRFCSIDGALYSKDKTTLFNCPCAAKTFDIPTTVTTIGVGAFGSCYELTSVTLHEGITTIESWAFQACEKLTEISLPEGLEEITWGTFSQCLKLSTVNLPESINKIENNAFRDCIALPVIDGITYAGNAAVAAREGIASVAIKEGTRILAENLFSDNQNLTSITLPSSLEIISTFAFSGCESLPVVDNVRYADCVAVEAIDKTMSTYVLREGTRFIAGWAFGGCSDMKSINLPEGLVFIGEGAFHNCDQLETITLPESTKHIPWSPFGRQTKVKSDSPRFVVENDMLCDMQTGTLISSFATGAAVVPAYVKRIGWVAFFHSDITSITLPEGLKTIDSYAFEFAHLSAIQIPESVTSIGGGAFFENRLTSVTIPRNVNKINYNPFQGCDQLESIYVAADNPYYTSIDGLLYTMDKSSLIACPGAKSGDLTLHSSLSRLEDLAFDGCTQITSLTLPSSTRYIGWYSMPDGLKDLYCLATKDISLYDDEDFMSDEVMAAATLHVPASVLEKYQNTYPWNKFGQIVPIDESEGILQPTTVLRFAMPCYSLDGRRMSKNDRGISIRNGAKILR